MRILENRRALRVVPGTLTRSTLPWAMVRTRHVPNKGIQIS